MKFAGFADEASLDIEGQISVTKELGWQGIEIRRVGEKVHFDDVDDDEFKRIKEKLDEGGIYIPCYGSQIANWARPVTGDFDLDVQELKRIMPRMQQTKTPYVRIMSYPNKGLEEGEWKKEVLRRIKELSKMAEDGGVVLVHENCDGWANLGPEQTLEMLSVVNSPALKLVFDTGNPVVHNQDAFEFYQKVKDHVVHMHIKDYVKESGDKEKAVYPGEGQGQVQKIVQDLIKSGYDGWYSMEPHMASVIHAGQESDNADAARQIYLQYAKTFEKIYNECQ
jgi:sugar phosphate isomerase/epimerase